MGFQSVREYIEAAYRDGKTWDGMWRRTAPALTVSMWADMSYGGGGPAANYYASAPGAWANLSAYDGIAHGPNVYPASKHLKRITIVPSAATGVVRLMLLDYIAYCPFFDGDIDAEQAPPFSIPLPSPHSPLIRHVDGKNVHLLLVSQGAGGAVGAFKIRYLNQDDVEKETTNDMNYGVFTNSAGLTLQGQYGGGANYAMGPFATLYPGDGIKELRGITLSASMGGVFAAVLVNVIANISSKDNSVSPYEIDYIDNLRMPVVEDGAYLNFIGIGTTAANPAHIANLEFIWS
jgi:hypothetical protein